MLVEGFRDVDRTRDYFPNRCDTRGRVFLLDGTDICSGTLLALLPSLKTDQNHFRFALMSCSKTYVLFYENKSIISLENQLNLELVKVNNWLCANKLSLNINKSNFVIFHPPQKNTVFSTSFC